ncbi:MAG: aminodeoxychorismate synthase, component I [Anaerolineaceae bacterium 4572_5.1]|nr:MAG: aminodeoxychorismate synthase, component I [Anaerolineaceae bacterium 4572_5.1]
MFHEIPYLDPVLAFQPFAADAYAIFLDSALVDGRLGRYSFIAADPFQTMTSKGNTIWLGNQRITGDPLEILRRELARYPLTPQTGIPLFQTGVAGYFAYDLCHHLEDLPIPGVDDMLFPDLALGFYDVVVAFDQEEHRAWIISSGHPAESHPPQIRSNFTRPAYENAVQRVIDYIYAGDIFQANVSQRFQAELPADDTPFNLYQRLRAINPAPFAAYLNLGETVIASASPERFLLLRGDEVETRPIKGTRPRGATPEADRALADELLASEKDRAENVMIVDLLRNDLSRACQDHSVNTPEICILESYATVHHLVSTVEGRLPLGTNAVDLLRVTIPGGSITGAPKIRAMEIIAELEPTWRGPYCGNIGYISFTGNMDTSIVIRTYAIQGNTVTFQAGGGIVADSDPAAEYEETIDKAQALMDALGDGWRETEDGR